MKSYKDPSFQDRLGRANAAKQKALEQLKAKPSVDEKVLAERREAAAAREAAEAEKRAARQAAKQQAEAEAAAARAASEAAKAAPALTEAEKKALRDQRYAARKSRK